MKRKISGEMDHAISKLNVARIAFVVCVAVAVVSFILAGALNGQETPLVILVVGILAAVFVKRVWQKEIRQSIDAIVDFDEHYFDGEIIHKRKNRIPL